MLSEAGGKVIAGGTDVYPSAKQGEAVRTYLDVTRIAGLSGISQAEHGYVIGAATTWSDIVRADLPPAFDALKQAALQVGSIQIQNAGTIAGNLCNASPAADGIPPLLVLDASVEVVSSARGRRAMPLSDFVLGVRKTALASDELVSAVFVPRPPGRSRSAFEKLGSRKYLVISISMVAALVTIDPTGVIADARVAVGACSPFAQRLTDLERSCVGRSPAEVEILPDHLSSLSPIDDVRGTAEFRDEAVLEQCKRAIERACGHE